jgi:hypothetical protein
MKVAGVEEAESMSTVENMKETAVMTDVKSMKSDFRKNTQYHYNYGHIRLNCADNIKMPEILICAIKYIAYIAVRKMSNLFCISWR